MASKELYLRFFRVWATDNMADILQTSDLFARIVKELTISESQKPVLVLGIGLNAFEDQVLKAVGAVKDKV